jgi:hypothetical protein
MVICLHFVVPFHIRHRPFFGINNLLLHDAHLTLQIFASTTTILNE